MPNLGEYQGMGLSEHAGEMAGTLADTIPERSPTREELAFFQSRPEVAGYAADDGAVVINPFGVAAKNPQARASVLLNERLRHMMRRQKTPKFAVQPGQAAISPEYAADPNALRQTIMARMLSGDPSLAPYSIEQARGARDSLRTMRQGLR